MTASIPETRAFVAVRGLSDVACDGEDGEDGVENALGGRERGDRRGK
jgi:hypothetical protein